MILRNLILFINSVFIVIKKSLLYIHFHVIHAIYILLIIKPSILWYKLSFEIVLKLIYEYILNSILNILFFIYDIYLYNIM